MTFRKRRILAALLALALCLSLLPMSALAAEADALGETGPEEAVCTCTAPCTEGGINTACPVCGAEGAAPEDCGQSLPQGSGEAKTQPLANDGISLLSTQEKVSYIDPTKEQTEQTCDSATVVTADDTTWGDDGNNGWYVVNSNVTISTRVTVTGDVHLILADGASLDAAQGVNVGAGNSLTIYGQSGGTGKLTATGGGFQAGIGGNSNQSGTITINGGTVTATGGDGGAGIGGGKEAEGGTITINGGTVNATGSTDAAGIGGGGGGNGGNITINGGTVTATGSTTPYSGSAGIGGGGVYGSGGTIIIRGGTVIANGAGGAGIGGGSSGAGGTITISGGTVIAKGSGSPGIGGGGGHGAAGTFSTGEDGNAVIFAIGNGTTDTRIDEKDTSSWDCVFFRTTPTPGNVVYGDVTLENDLTIDSERTLTIPAGTSLTIPTDVTLTVNGEITNNGTLAIQGPITGTGSITPKFKQTVSELTANVSQVTDTTLTIETVTKPEGAIGDVQYGYTTGDETEVPAARWSSNSTFSGLAPATKYTIYVRYSGNGFYEPVVSDGVEVYTAHSVPRENEGYTINYANETVTAASDYEVRPAESDNWMASGTALSITPGGTFQVRHAAATDGAPASEPLTVNVEARPAAPILAIDNEAEGVTIPSGYFYNTTSEDYSNTWTQGKGSLVKIEPGSSIYIYQSATDRAFKSAVQTLTAPERASTPTLPTINYENETLSGTTTAMEYALGQNVPSQWEDCSDNMSLTSFGWDGSEAVTVQFRTAATENNYASDPTAGLTIPARPDAPVAPSVDDKTDTSITITTLDGVEYRLGTDGSWQTGTGSITFDNLSAGMEYTIYARYPAVTEGENPAFASGSASTQVTTKSNQTAAPTAPTMSSRTTTSVILNYIESPIRQGAVQYGYTTAGDSSDYHWQESTEFIDLQPGTTYTFYARYAETDDYEASPASTGTSIVTLGAAGGDTLADGETITTDDGTTITNDGEKITVTPGDGGATITITPDKGATVNGDGSVNVPGGSTVTTGDGPSITVGEGGATVGTDGGVTLPDGGSATIGSGDDATTITTPGGGTIDPDTGAVTPDEGGSVVIGSGDDTTTITPPSGQPVTPDEDGTITVPDGSTVTTGDGPEMTLPGGGTIDPDTGAVTPDEGGSVTIGSGEDTTTITPPSGQPVTPNEDGTITIPDGSTVQTGDGPEMTLPEGGTIDPDTGAVTPDEGGSVVIGSGEDTTTITPPSGQPVTPNDDGSVTIPGGSTVTDSDGESVTIPPEGGTLQPGGEVKYTVTVTFDSQGGSQVPSQDITVGEPVSQPDDPTRTGYRFLGWYTAATGGAHWDFTQPVTGDQTLYAQWAYLPPANPNYKITIGDTENGTVTVNPTAAKEGTTVTITPVPDAGYQVGTVSVTDRFGQAVAVDQQADGTYTFVMPDGQVTVEVTFLQGEAPDLPFSDVTESDWFYDAVTYAYENGLMDGVGAGLFAPNSETTRAQLVTILHRLAGQPAPSGDSGFSDVETGTWYTDAVAWAAQNGIVNGVSDTQFAPGDDITREQLAVILYRYATYQGYDVSQRAGLSGFVDAGTISTYAQEALSWASAQGLVLGFEDDSLRPQGNASRAQIAAVLMRFCQTVAE